MKKTTRYYLGLTYPIELIEDAEEGGFFAQHPDLPGCAAQGESAEEAVANLKAARALWIKTRLEDGLAVPEPFPEDPSGKFLLRMMPELHAGLMQLAQRRGVSLNHLLIAVLAEYMGGAPYREELARICDRLSKTAATAQRSQEVITQLAVAGAQQSGSMVTDSTPAAQLQVPTGIPLWRGRGH